MNCTALATFGKKTKSHDWFETNFTELNPIIKGMRTTLAEYKQSSNKNLQILRAASSKAQQTARHCTSEYWKELSKNIQTAAIMGSIRGM